MKHECDELAMINQGIGKEMPKMKFESNEIDGQTVYFDLSFRRFVEEFDCFEISIFECIDVILSIEYVFRCVYTLWSCFESSLNFISDCNINLNLFCPNEVMMKNIERISFVITNNGTDSYRFFSNFF
jgi:hypothetical protein